MTPTSQGSDSGTARTQPQVHIHGLSDTPDQWSYAGFRMAPAASIAPGGTEPPCKPRPPGSRVRHGYALSGASPTQMARTGPTKYPGPSSRGLRDPGEPGSETVGPVVGAAQTRRHDNPEYPSNVQQSTLLTDRLRRGHRLRAPSARSSRDAPSPGCGAELHPRQARNRRW